jgi:hypothetical protein
MTPARQKFKRSQPENLPQVTDANSVLPLAIVAAVSAWLLTQSFPLYLSTIGLLLLLAVGATLLLRSSLIPALLFLTQAVLFVSDRSSLQAVVTLDGQIVAASLLALLLSLQRYLQLPEPARLRELLEQTFDRFKLPNWLIIRRKKETTTFRSSAGFAELLLIGLRVIAAVVFAAWLLALVPVNPEAPNDVALRPTAHRSIKLGVSFAVAVIVLNTILNSIAWRRLTPRCARLFHYLELTEWCGREIRAILRLEEKHKRRRR